LPVTSQSPGGCRSAGAGVVIHSGRSARSTTGRRPQRRRIRSGERDIAEAAARTNLQAAGRLSRLVDGRPQFVPQPPVIERLDDLMPDDQRQRLEEGRVGFSEAYADRTERDHAALVRAVGQGRFEARAGV
jgi:hypothetical protein